MVQTLERLLHQLHPNGPTEASSACMYIRSGSYAMITIDSAIDMHVRNFDWIFVKRLSNLIVWCLISPVL